MKKIYIGRVFVFAATCLAAFAGGIARAAEIETTVSMETRSVRFQNGVNGYAGALEAGLDKKKPKTASKGKVLIVQRPTDEEGQQVLVQFRDIIGPRSGQVPPGAEITKAVLRVFTGGKTSLHRIFFNRMLVPWNEDATWNSRAWGQNGVPLDDRAALAKPDANNVFYNKNQYYEVDVTESLRAWSEGAPNHGWVLHNVRTHSGPFGYCSSKMDAVGHRPELIVTFDANPSDKAPRVDALSASFAKSRTAGGTATLNLQATDADDDSVKVVFYGRKQAEAAPDYSIILMPDTQYYTRERFGGTLAMLESQVAWIAKQAKRQNIACVFHLGDISDQGDIDELQWKNAAKALYKLEDAALSGLPQGVPYCLAVGNHDQKYPEKGEGGPAKFYNKYFGISHFTGKKYYGGHYGNDNNNYYVLFDAGPEKGLVMSMEYARAHKDPELIKWAVEVFKKHADRRGFVITHYTMAPGLGSPYSPEAAAIHEALKGCPNLMAIIGGHITGEGRRTDVHNGNTVYGIVQDFQFDENGGSGFLGIMTLSPRQNRIHIKTYSPFLNESRTDPASDYSLEYDFGTKIEKYEELGRMNIRSGESAKCIWNNLKTDAAYEWFSEISDGKKTTRTEPQTFQPKSSAAK